MCTNHSLVNHTRSCEVDFSWSSKSKEEISASHLIQGLKWSKFQLQKFIPNLVSKTNDDFWSIESLCVYPVINKIPQHKGVMFQNGISFILKKDSGYIIYYVDKEGIPGAVDTTGKIYSNTEAIKYLQEYDKDKFEESRQRAKDLDLLDQFDSAAVLVWGQKYYSTVEKLESSILI